MCRRRKRGRFHVRVDDSNFEFVAQRGLVAVLRLRVARFSGVTVIVRTPMNVSRCSPGRLRNSGVFVIFFRCCSVTVADCERVRMFRFDRCSTFGCSPGSRCRCFLLAGYVFDARGRWTTWNRFGSHRGWFCCHWQLCSALSTALDGRSGSPGIGSTACERSVSVAPYAFFFLGVAPVCRGAAQDGWAYWAGITGAPGGADDEGTGLQGRQLPPVKLLGRWSKCAVDVPQAFLTNAAHPRTQC